ncbi:unnamed protein product [Prunus brigantina]
MASDSPLDSQMSQDSPIQKEPRPIGLMVVKAKRGVLPAMILQNFWSKLQGTTT